MDKGELILLVINTIPISNQITDLDLSDDDGSIRFNWGGKRFRISQILSVDEVKDGYLISCTNETVLMEKLFKLSKHTGAYKQLFQN